MCLQKCTMDSLGRTSTQISQDIVETDLKDFGDANPGNLQVTEHLQICHNPSGDPELIHINEDIPNKTNSPEEINLLNINHLQIVSSIRHTGSESAEDIPGLEEVKDLFDIFSESEDDVGCPLPSTPEDENALVTEITEVLKAGVLNDEIDLTSLTRNPTLETEKFVMKVCDSWKVCHYSNLPNWMRDNDFLISGYRPPLPSFYACFKSIFRLHTETANIWTHLLGCIAFIALATYFLTRTSKVLNFGEKLVFSAFFMGVIICFGLSTAYHTLHCHSECVGRLFSKLDYCGIALLIMGSFVPWLYYGFYCNFHLTMIYLSIVICLGIVSIVVSLWDKFSEPRFRPLRAGLFLAFGLSGVVPAVHYSVAEGWINAVSQASLHWLLLMGCLYVLGALFYALRIPERFFPGMCDIWFQSHQIFHVLVIAAAFVHFHGISEMAMNRMTMTNDFHCSNQR